MIRLSIKLKNLLISVQSSKDRVKYTNRTNVLFKGLLWHRCGDGEIRKLHLDNKKDKYENIIYSYRCSHCRRNFYKDVRKTYGGKKYNKLLEDSVLQLISNMSIEELENKNIKIALDSNKRELHKKQIVIRNMENELIDIFSGESFMDKDILVGMITKTKGEIEVLEGNIKLLDKEFSEANKVISIDRNLIEQYRNFNFAYGTADIKQKKLLLQEVIEKITFDADKIIITLYLN